jgi:hypothetical protein
LLCKIAYRGNRPLGLTLQYSRALVCRPEDNPGARLEQLADFHIEL